MLPGFKIFFATIILSVSVLVFGLGAAALLRSAHDDFVSMPSWRLAQQPLFIPAGDASRPTLSLLRAEPPAAAEKTIPVEPKADAKPEAKIETNVETKIDEATTSSKTAADAATGDIKTSEAKASDDKIASLDPQVTPNAAIETAEPAKPKLRRSKRLRARAINQRRRTIVRTRAPRTVEQQPAQTFPSLFSGT